MDITVIADWFIPFKLKRNTEKFRRARYYVLTYLALAFLLLIYIFIYYVTKKPLQFYLYLGSEIVIILSLFILRKTGALTLLANFGVVTFSILLWTQVYITGGIFSPHLTWIGFIPILAFLFTGRIYGLLWSSMILVMTILIFYLELTAYINLKPDAFSLDATYYFKSILPFFIFLFVTILSYEKSKLKDIKRLEKAKNEILKNNEILAEQNEEIIIHLEEIEKQRDVVTNQKREITDSILYAKRIQEALLPPDEVLDEALSEYCVLFKPKDIVSGDFYWLKKIENLIIIAVADCTGHGVPGAFMSMLGVSLLNETVINDDEIKANQILNQLRDKLKKSLRQSGKRGEQKDGMDIALCIIDTEKMKIQYSGAYNPMYLFRNNNIIEFQGDKNPVGIYILEKESFTNHETDIQKGDVIYIFTDGYIDQMGGTYNKKFLSGNFKKLLLNIHKNPMNEQKTILEKTITDWKKNKEQVDDILIFGMKI
ncbi:MAG: SpoIIE family protein phosphatase [Bacteroidales bacterium]|nr:SpoIIE family protein phosphatase [Bacteroidales bacterium]